MGPAGEIIGAGVETSSYLVPVYITYAVISIGLTVWLASVLSKNGAVFLRDVFADNNGLAEAVNRLLVVGFYLVNLGYASLLLRADPAPSAIAAIETLAVKLGLLLLSLAAMHFVNMYVFHRIRRQALDRDQNARQVAHATVPGHTGHSAFEMVHSKQRRETDHAPA